jgi:hypothetical protein
MYTITYDGIANEVWTNFIKIVSMLYVGIPRQYIKVFTATDNGLAHLRAINNHYARGDRAPSL